MATPSESSAGPQLVRLVERERSVVAFTLDGVAASAREGDTILTAVLTLRRHLVEAGGEAPRSGFCLMGACPECWGDAGGKPARAGGPPLTPAMPGTTAGPKRGGGSRGAPPR